LIVRSDAGGEKYLRDYRISLKKDSEQDWGYVADVHFNISLGFYKTELIAIQSLEIFLNSLISSYSVPCLKMVFKNQEKMS
jgi:hypothetical protein